MTVDNSITPAFSTFITTNHLHLYIHMLSPILCLQFLSLHIIAHAPAASDLFIVQLVPVLEGTAASIAHFQSLISIHNNSLIYVLLSALQHGEDGISGICDESRATLHGHALYLHPASHDRQLHHVKITGCQEL